MKNMSQLCGVPADPNMMKNTPASCKQNDKFMNR